MKTITYRGINPQIVATAKILATHTMINLQLPPYEMDDLIQQLVIEGIHIEREYRPGERSLSSHLTERMRYAQLSLMRSYLAEKRCIRLHQVSENSLQNKDGDAISLMELLPDTSVGNDIVGMAHMRDLLHSLSDRERTVAELLLQGFTAKETAEKMGVKLRWIERIRTGIRKKHPHFKK